MLNPKHRPTDHFKLIKTKKKSFHYYNNKLKK